MRIRAGITKTCSANVRLCTVAVLTFITGIVALALSSFMLNSESAKLKTVIDYRTAYEKLKAENELYAALLEKQSGYITELKKEVESLKFELENYKQATERYVISSVLTYETSEVVSEPDGGLSKYGINNKYHDVDIYRLSYNKAYDTIRESYYKRAGLDEFRSVRLQIGLLHMCVLFGPRAIDVAKSLYSWEYLSELTDNSPEIYIVLDRLSNAYKKLAISVKYKEYHKGWINRIDKVFRLG